MQTNEPKANMTAEELAEDFFFKKFGNKITAIESWAIRFAIEFCSQRNQSLTKEVADLNQKAHDEWCSVQELEKENEGKDEVISALKNELHISYKELEQAKELLRAVGSLSTPTWEVHEKITTFLGNK